jgi:hypothetical protein
MMHTGQSDLTAGVVTDDEEPEDEGLGKGQSIPRGRLAFGGIDDYQLATDMSK